MSEAREEAERLVAAALAAASVAARNFGATGSGGSRFATGSAECCICPVCRTIAAMRDPNPEFAERLASGAGDLAAAVAGVLRSFTRAGSGEWRAAGERADSRAGGEPEADPQTGGDSEAEVEQQTAGGERAGAAEDSDPWRAATRGTEPTTPRYQPPQPKPMAKKAVKKAAPKSPPPDTAADEET